MHTISIIERCGDRERTIVLEVITPQPEPIAASAALEWSDTLCNGERVTYAEAEKACAALGPGWRLPTRTELESILDLTRHAPAVDDIRFPDTKKCYYWSSTPCAWATSVIWMVDFNDGNVGTNGVYYDAFVRAVRSISKGE